MSSGRILPQINLGVQGGIQGILTQVLIFKSFDYISHPSAFAAWGTLNSRRATSPLVLFVEGEEKCEALGHPQGVLPLNWGGTEKNRTVIYMVIKAKDNDRRKNSSS
ncbi:uncharacterized protein TNCV_18391 [Trichonephila clavipes]|nr:uncharacterized protein TNCV_18391 [Trichonephila clavipes]